MGEGFPALLFFLFFSLLFFFAFGSLLLLKKDFEGLIDVFPLYKSRMQEKPSTTFFRLILYIFIFR